MAAEPRPPFPPFTLETAIQKARLGYSLDRQWQWRSRAELVLDRKSKRELGQRLDHQSLSALGL